MTQSQPLNPAKFQSNFLFVYPNFGLSEAEMRESILRQGVRDSVYLLHGLVIDGAKRVKICSELGLTYKEIHFLTPADAAPALWLRHRDRCARLFPCATISEAAQFYATDLASVSHLFAAPAPIKQEPGYWKTFDAAREAILSGVRMPPSLWSDLTKASRRYGLKRSHLIRVACAFAVDNMDQIIEFDRIFGPRLRYRTGPKGASGPKLRKRPKAAPRGPKWPG